MRLEVKHVLFLIITIYVELLCYMLSELSLPLQYHIIISRGNQEAITLEYIL